MKGNDQKTKQPIFTSYRSITQLLKKSLPSIGINKKKDIFDRLDSIQRDAEKNEEKLIKKEFQELINSTLALCNQMSFQQIIFDVERSMMSIKNDKPKSDNQS